MPDRALLKAPDLQANEVQFDQGRRGRQLKINARWTLAPLGGHWGVSEELRFALNIFAPACSRTQATSSFEAV
ncbi:hypothetical protein SNOG_06497 [Parastagonospora nodorum SN15]|uniref:Uncharacterized protein n=1 Tax=Phaeosphaeria nodorum (strain SN15 / ATCC MYA-4574 / FGSC 10173) TaxID=321614 RepID=Q0UP17_PHANO|nr:hypothetical protein SNOG_06497 [Parastagonospora nodorum SN15]EAT86328.1 hypothetical protein SNOG_06497 [Parastagonospora nodorum SN15]